MTKRFCSHGLLGLLVWTLLLPATVRAQSPVTVQHTEGLIHGFLVLRTLEGEALADGELTQVARGDRVTSHLVFHFKDGSLHEETVVFSQRRNFRLISDHLLQKGPAFKHPMDVSIDGSTGQTTVRYTDDDGKDKEASERLKIPPDLANGIILILLKNIPPDTAQTKFSMVAATPKPRLVKLLVSPEGEDSFSVGASRHKATRFVLKVEIGGVAGVVAPLVGKQPPDTHVWIAGGDAPVFVKSEGSLYVGGPVWRIELASPSWPDH